MRARTLWLCAVALLVASQELTRGSAARFIGINGVVGSRAPPGGTLTSSDENDIVFGIFQSEATFAILPLFGYVLRAKLIRSERKLAIHAHTHTRALTHAVQAGISLGVSAHVGKMCLATTLRPNNNSYVDQ